MVRHAEELPGVDRDRCRAGERPSPADGRARMGTPSAVRRHGRCPAHGHRGPLASRKPSPSRPSPFAKAGRICWPRIISPCGNRHRITPNETCIASPVAMLGASQRIHADALPMFTGKRVRIFGHDDDAGRARWNAGPRNWHPSARTWTPSASPGLRASGRQAREGFERFTFDGRGEFCRKRKGCCHESTNHIYKPGSGAMANSAGHPGLMKAKKKFHPSRFSIFHRQRGQWRKQSPARNARPKLWPDVASWAFLSASIGAGLEVTSGPNRVTRGNLYIMASAESGSGKSETFRHAAKPFFAYERDMVERWRRRNALPGLQAEADLLESEIAKLKKDALQR